MPNAFELYGVDFLVSHDSTAPSDIKLPLQVQLLEINSEPAIELTGPRLTWIFEDLFLAIGEVCILPFFSMEGTASTPPECETGHCLRKCLEVLVRGSGAP